MIEKESPSNKDEFLEVPDSIGQQGGPDESRYEKVSDKYDLKEAKRRAPELKEKILNLLFPREVYGDGSHDDFSGRGRDSLYEDSYKGSIRFLIPNKYEESFTGVNITKRKEFPINRNSEGVDVLRVEVDSQEHYLRLGYSNNTADVISRDYSEDFLGRDSYEPLDMNRFNQYNEILDRLAQPGVERKSL